MDDLELTRLCADAMGLEVWKSPIRGTIMRYWFTNNRVVSEYAPLHDDEQAMALVKKFYIHLWHDTRWAAQLRDRTDTQSIDDDLNRAICECVAKMQAANAASAAASERA